MSALGTGALALLPVLAFLALMRLVDSFQLVKKDGRWWIVSVVNDLPSPEYPVPAALR